MRTQRNRWNLVAAVLLTSALLTPLAPAAQVDIMALGPQGINVGEPAPDFTFQDGAGKWVSLSDFRGKKVLLFSWSSWCRCKYQLPSLEVFYREHKSDTFEVVAVASDSQGFKWGKPYLDVAGATFTALVDPNNELPRKYNCLATENAWLIDEAGIVRMNAVPFYADKPEHKNEVVALLKQDFGGAADAAPKKSVDELIAESEQALAQKPGAINMRLELAELYRRKGDLKKSESMLRDAVKRRPLSSRVHYRLGVVLHQQGRIEEAVKQWERAYSLELTSYVYMRNVQSYHDPDKFYADLDD